MSVRRQTVVTILPAERHSQEPPLLDTIGRAVQRGPMGAKRRSGVIDQNPLATEILARFGTSGEVTVERLESELAAGRASKGRAARSPSGRTAPLASAPLPKPDAQRQAAPALLEHSFHIRKGVLTSLRLPADVTSDEIERLCQFLQAIPFR